MANYKFFEDYVTTINVGAADAGTTLEETVNKVPQIAIRTSAERLSLLGDSPQSDVKDVYAPGGSFIL